MAATFFVWSKPRLSVGASLTRQWPAANAHGTQLSGVGNLFTAGFPGTLSNLYQRLVTNDRGASTIRLRKNGANGNQLLSIGASSGAAEFEDDVNTDAIVTGDEVDIELITGAGGTTFIQTVGALKFAATTNTVTRIHSTDHGAMSTASTTFFFPLGGRCSTPGTVEADATAEMQTAGTFKYYGIRVATNARSTDTVTGIRISGVDGTVIFTVTAGSTGTFLNATNSDAVVVGDDACFYVRLGTGTGSFTPQAGQWIDFETTNDKWQLFAGNAGGDSQSTFSASTTYYLAIGGSIVDDYTTESEVQVKSQLAFTGSKLHVRVTANTVVGASTLKFRKNAADGGQSVSITGLTTGLFIDATGSDSVAVNDEICCQLAVGAGGTSLNLSVTSMLCSTPAAGGSIDLRAQRRRLLNLQRRARWEPDESPTFSGVFAGPFLRLTGTNQPPTFPLTFAVLRRRLNLTKLDSLHRRQEDRYEFRASPRIRSQPYKALTDTAPPPPPNPPPLAPASRRMQLRMRHFGL